MAAQSARTPRFGVQLQAQRTTWPDYLATVKAVEGFGYDSLWNFDHMLPFSGDPSQPCFETWTTLTAMAMATSRIRIGALVNGVMYRDPATLAKSAVMVDQISGGRHEFALGAAWAEREFRAYGLPFPPVGERMSRLEEALDIVKSLWTQPRTTYSGQYYTINDAPCEPKPLQQPYPPIMIGGNGPRTIRIAAQHANIWNGMGSPEALASSIARLKDECAKIGRDVAEIELSCHPLLAIARSREEAERKARAAASRVEEDFDAQRDRWLLGT
ncbi:MAG: Luciferase-like monooxygenase, partial [Chloroflexi bacterium]|nr:Luciferase-like monooxygenase [Chloroflexota bacterium]